MCLEADRIFIYIFIDVLYLFGKAIDFFYYVPFQAEERRKQAMVSACLIDTVSVAG